MQNNEEEKIVTILYTNYQGKTAQRRIIPKEILYTSTQWHPQEQWCMLAFDLRSQQERCFALKDVLKWEGPQKVEAL
jgi:predicted DNA-binding transcriptional regulator YafY